ncbi:hypothetical protein CLAIMM_11740 [Cladophialophora immunda]|nr:hypothetical protein CLAIMM_11740 [Cladophialophora immunda]
MRSSTAFLAILFGVQMVAGLPIIGGPQPISAPMVKREPSEKGSLTADWLEKRHPSEAGSLTADWLEKRQPSEKGSLTADWLERREPSEAGSLTAD